MRFFLWNKGIYIIQPNKENVFMVPNHEKKEIIMWIHFFHNWKMNCNSKSGRKRSFSYETKALISVIPMKRICLWCLIIKRKEITMWTRVYPDWKMNINSKIGRKRSFSYEIKGSISFIPMSKMSLRFQVMRTKEIITWICVYPNW